MKERERSACLNRKRGVGDDAYFVDLCKEELRKHLQNVAPERHHLYEERLRFEMEQLRSWDYIDYFLTLYALRCLMREKKISTGSARYEAGGSLVLYLFGVTHIDPLRYGLFFERFLNIETGYICNRVGIDVDPQRRHELIDAFTKRYGTHYLSGVELFTCAALTRVSKTLARIEERYGKKIDLRQIDLNDKKLYAPMRHGDTVGIWSLNFTGMDRLLQRLHAERFEDIMALHVLYQPGAEYAGITEAFIKRKREASEKAVEYIVPELEPILKTTHGLILYPEQIIEIARTIGKFSRTEAAAFCRALFNKGEIRQRVQERFLCAAKENGYSTETAEKIFKMLAESTCYSYYGKSWAASDAFMTVQIAYLKVYYPEEFVVK